MVQASNKLFCLSKQALIVVIVIVYKLRKVRSLCCWFIECYYCYCRFISWFIDFMRWGVVFHKLLKGSYLFIYWFVCLLIYCFCHYLLLLFVGLLICIIKLKMKFRKIDSFFLRKTCEEEWDEEIITPTFEFVNVFSTQYHFRIWFIN
jgi:hypothetical protein